MVAQIYHPTAESEKVETDRSWDLLASVAKLVFPGFIEGPPFQKIRWEMTEEDTQYQILASLSHMLSSSPVHTCKHTHTLHTDRQTETGRISVVSIKMDAK